ncbi:dephospho-CoA kinase [Bacillus sp. GM2]|uniref:Dephospho-CoA kinase n=5 Tax=Bacillus licheniformis TaxID=1402 RepID=COAE_BACLD|nr:MULTISPECIES: dephospho-CoA kinase [Bacillus]Q65G95.1 RecName: Full=Dephospho-CoA kinase; AltName: Full=Dephosphocoenzyme A kinase [Bacillus licheniformis DSM 13 = ATCC 14580]MBY8347547.1 dephospho-CoA kinase [Bacillus sp. PCH94]MDP4081278.1 dephospho-CoA kinase [Bacillota bacterium]AAU24560.1 Dephospho-CoA kinase [Bacillus licheniformis DSM 13 = ATCC 14580]AAU41919.1 dephospho-CoA kinase YtaG [Bacillus licheniformis DSM 13 = ATCC 14580]AKQ74329.1 dephospho-CoA kinase [Bacillus licheniform
MTLVIGLTGGIASGKSTVAQMFQQCGITVVDADVIAKEAVEQGMPAYQKIAETFGEGVLLETGDIDRRKLGEIVFANEEKRLQLNAIVHPEVRKMMIKQRDEAIRAGERFVVLDIPLLYESGLEHLTDKVIVVWVPMELQLERLMKRNRLNKDEALNRIHAQQSLDEKKKRADAVIDNSGSLKDTEAQLHQLLDTWSNIEK